MQIGNWKTIKLKILLNHIIEKHSDIKISLKNLMNVLTFTQNMRVKDLNLRMGTYY